MQLELYRFTGETNRLDKSAWLTAMTTVNANLKDDTDIMHPVFILKKSALVAGANYFYCSFFGRYYFIQPNTTEMLGGRVKITGEVDPLMSFKTDLRACPAWIERAETDPDADGAFLATPYPFLSKTETYCREFPNDLFTSSGNNTLFIMQP